MPQPPRDGLDRTFAFLFDPYRYIARRSRELGSDVFETRLMLVPTLCMTGPDAAALFHDDDRFERAEREQTLMGFVTEDRILNLVSLFRTHLEYAASRWTERPSIVLYDALQPVLLRAVCSWAGVPLEPTTFDRRRRDVVSLFESSDAIGRPQWRGRAARQRSERWIARLVDAIRAARLRPRPDSPLAVVAARTDEAGRPVASRVAAVQLLDLVRPIVALAVDIAFGVHALLRNQKWRPSIASDRTQRLAFIEEVRRFYPSCPWWIARVRETFEWRGMTFLRGRRAMLDLYGTNHDPRVWISPGTFRPERFLATPPRPVALGDGGTNAGQKIAMSLMDAALSFFAGRLAFDVPSQNLGLVMTRLPALPASGIVLSNLRLLEPAVAHVSIAG